MEEGDVIVALNEVDTRSMSGVALTVMISGAVNSKRVFTIVRQTNLIQHDFEAMASSLTRIPTDHLSYISEKSNGTSVPDSAAESIASKGEEEQQKESNIPSQPSVSSESKTVVWETFRQLVHKLPPKLVRHKLKR